MLHHVVMTCPTTQPATMRKTATRARILAALQSGPLTTMALADAIDASPSVRAAGIRHTLKRLQTIGVVRVVDRLRRQGKPAVVWGLA